ncbi:unnamed protein product [Rhodiola kirilowii]
MAEEQDWSSIQPDIGCAIFNKLPEIVDRIWFGAVCKNWYYIAKDYNPLASRSRLTLPMLLVPVNECETQRKLYGVSSGKFYSNIRLSDIPNERCCGSSHGWLAFVEEDLSVTLVSPFKFKGIHIRLPVMDTCGAEPNAKTVSKLIVSPDSTPDNYTVVAIYDGMLYLAFIRSGDKDWTYIEKYLRKRVIFADIVFHKGLIYATDRRFMVVSVDINSHPPRVRILKREEPFNLYEKWCTTYIIKSTSGDLYAIRRRAEYDFITVVFKIMKLEFHQESGELIRYNEVNTLDGDAFFIGESDSISVKASDYEGCKPNSIYFIDDYWIADGRGSNDEVEDSGIYNVEEKSIVRHYVRDPNHRFRPPSIWVQPLFC